MLATLQYLRAASASLVVLFHAGRNYDLSIPVGEGRISLFFIVSGFIFWWITAGSQTGPRVFLLRRLARLVPLYWVVTLILFLGSVLGVSHHARISISHLVQSLLFIPHVDERSGQIFPVLVPGWTLIYEMLFCFVFSALLWVAQGRRLLIASAVFGGLAAVGFIFHPTDPIAFTYTNEILIEFLAGVWLAWLWPRIRLTKAASAAILLLGVVLSFVALGLQGRVPFVLYSGLPAILTIIGALGLERPDLKPIAWLKRIGDSSYSIYLWHIPVIVIGSRALALAHIDSPVLAIGILTLASLAAGLILYELTERPLTEALFGRIDARAADGRVLSVAGAGAAPRAPAAPASAIPAASPRRAGRAP
jgi:exopolysaccharide production protein ExoZ